MESKSPFFGVVRFFAVRNVHGEYVAKPVTWMEDATQFGRRVPAGWYDLDGYLYLGKLYDSESEAIEAERSGR
jgi:hypothetical protein